MQAWNEKLKEFWKVYAFPMMKIVWNFLIILCLYYVFLKIFYILFPVSFVVVVWHYTYKKKWSESLPIMVKTLYETIYNFDRYCNREFRTLWNTVFISEGGYAFGNINETLSAALGKNQLYFKDKVTLIGWVVIYLLWAVDWTAWKKGGHCIASINYNV